MSPARFYFDLLEWINFDLNTNLFFFRSWNTFVVELNTKWRKNISRGVNDKINWNLNLTRAFWYFIMKRDNHNYFKTEAAISWIPSYSSDP